MTTERELCSYNKFPPWGWIKYLPIHLCIIRQWSRSVICWSWINDQRLPDHSEHWKGVKQRGSLWRFLSERSMKCHAHPVTAVIVMSGMNLIPPPPPHAGPRRSDDAGRQRRPPSVCVTSSGSWFINTEAGLFDLKISWIPFKWIIMIIIIENFTFF